MDFGFVFFGSVAIAPTVAIAEKRGFSHAWLYDSQMLASDVYAALALSAVQTKTIVLGPGVTNPMSRIAPQTACAIASINALAPGRTILGIGTGNTARRTLGMPALVHCPSCETGSFAASSSNNPLASCKSLVSNPSVNQP